MPAQADTLTLSRKTHERERDEIQRRLKAFDSALEDLRDAKDRLQKAADMYLERLEGTRRAK